MKAVKRRTRLLVGCGALVAVFAGFTGAGGGVAAAAPAAVSGSTSLFAATSASFPTADEGYVLGTISCADAPCPSSPPTLIERTLDRGKHWQDVTAPDVPIGDPGSATHTSIWGIRFATGKVGFVFGKGLWETLDGGAHWTVQKVPATTVNALAISDGQVLAVATPCAPGTCTSQHSALYRRPLSGGSWHLVAKLTSAFDLQGTATISAEGKVAAVLDGSTVLVTSDGGLRVTRHATGCTKADIGGPAGVAVGGAHTLALLCAGEGAAGSVGKAVYLSSDLGAHWTAAGTPPAGGDPEAIAATPGHIVVSAESGASEIYYSASGKHWSAAFGRGDGGMGFTDLGFTTGTAGAVVYGPVWANGNFAARPGELLLTGDGGAVWHHVTF